MENNNQKNEQLLLEMANELEKKNKTIWASYVGNYDRKYYSANCRSLYYYILDTRRSVATCHDSWYLRCIFDTVLLCIKA